MKLRNHKGFRIIFSIEMICLIAGFLLLLKPNANITYQSDKLQYDAGIPMGSFAYSSYSGIYIDNSMKQSESQEYINATIPNVNLLPGSYQIIINYSSSDGDNSFTCSCDNNWTDFWKFENVVLPAGEDQSQIVKISSALPMKEVSVLVSYNGNGYLYLSSIQILGNKSLAIQIIYYSVLIILATVCFSSLWIKYGNEEKKLLFILTSAAFASSLPLFGILLGFGDDLEYHLLRIDALANGLKNVQLPVRISTYWNNGYGYASSLFYNDLFLIFPALLRLLGLSVQSAYKQYVVACNIATVCITWYSFRKLFSKKISLVGTLIYVFQPYRLSCLYKRAAVGEYTAMIFYPLIFWGLYNIYSAEPAPKETKGIKRIIYNVKIILPAVLGYSGIVSSHVISLLLVGTVTIIFCIVMLKKTFRPSILIRLLAAVGMIILVNTWYLIPMADSMRSGISANSIASIRNFQKHGTYTFQLFDIFPNGDGQSLYAQDEINPPEVGEHDMSYSAGVGIISICIWIYYIAANKTKKGKIRTIGNTSCALCALCLYMTTIWFPWDFLTKVVPLAAKIFGNIQFSWRYLGLAGTLSTINAMCLIETVNCSHEKTNNIGKIISVSFISLTIISALYFLHSYEITTKWNDYTSDVAVTTTHLQGAEYLPDNTKIEIFNNPNPTPSTSVILSSFERKGDEIILTIEGTNGTDSYIDVPFLYYPGYVARYQTTGQMLDTVKAPDNRVRVIVPSGYNGTITVKYRERMLWRLGDIITAISALGIIVIIIKSQNIIKDKRIS